MFVEAPAEASLVVCTTCGGGETPDGERLLATLRRILAGHRASARLTLQPMACLFACASACTVHLRAPGKMGYLLGRFGAGEADALAICDYAAAYIESAAGVVNYADWPDGVKGRFIARLPPEGFLWRDDPAV